MAITTETISAPKKTRTKKEQIVSLYPAGIRDLQEISDATYSKVSYVASVLQGAGLIDGYYDLYNDAAQPMNAYPKLFQNRLGFKDIETALASIRLLHEAYLEFEVHHDRAGQHHVLMLAMKMYNRARWSGKADESQIFKRWLTAALDH